jgi:uncharacterized protein YacL (UPF0231 family)|tara:strand:- start:3337 stop:3870 length:534 start_codon:yes stop_codon:yes gene_type:complete
MYINSKNLLNDTNYIEVVFVKESVEPTVYDIHFCDIEIANMLYKLKLANQTIKPFQKEYQKYLYDSLEYNVNEKESTVNLYNMKFQNSELTKDIVVNYYQRQSLPIHTFPSTTTYEDNINIKKTIIKLLNNVYLNFESIQYDNDEVFNHVYFNCNITKKCDIDLINSTLENYINILK